MACTQSGSAYLGVPFDLLNYDRTDLIEGVGGQTRYIPEQGAVDF